MKIANELTPAIGDAFIASDPPPVSMSEPDRAELQRLAQLVEVNRERLQSLENQIRSLEGIKLEQEHAIEALVAISHGGVKGAMIPLGAGVQVVADIPANAGAEVDVGSRIQAEKTREEATQILAKRHEELRAIMDTVKKEYDELEAHIVELAKTFNEAVEGIQLTDVETVDSEGNTEAAAPKRRTRRKRGRELTLDD